MYLQTSNSSPEVLKTPLVFLAAFLTSQASIDSNLIAWVCRGSSNVNEVIKAVLSQSIFLQELTLNNKGNNFSRVQTSKRVKVTYFALVYI